MLESLFSLFGLQVWYLKAAFWKHIHGNGFSGEGLASLLESARKAILETSCRCWSLPLTLSGLYTCCICVLLSIELKYLLELWELSSMISSISNTWNYVATIFGGQIPKELGLLVNLISMDLYCIMEGDMLYDSGLFFNCIEIVCVFVHRSLVYKTIRCACMTQLCNWCIL